MEKFKPFIIPVALLVLIDQMVKIVISKVFMKYEFDIIAKVLRFNPELNTRLSYAGNFFELLSSPFVTILLNVFVLFLFLSGYMLYQAKRAHTSFWVKMIMICGISGCLCSLIDKVFWGGSLDFLQIPTLFIFDLKDCYLTVAEVIFVVIGILNSKEISVKSIYIFVVTNLACKLLVYYFLYIGSTCPELSQLNTRHLQSGTPSRKSKKDLLLFFCQK